MLGGGFYLPLHRAKLALWSSTLCANLSSFAARGSCMFNFLSEQGTAGRGLLSMVLQASGLLIDVQWKNNDDLKYWTTFQNLSVLFIQRHYLKRYCRPVWEPSKGAHNVTPDYWWLTIKKKLGFLKKACHHHYCLTFLAWHIILSLAVTNVDDKKTNQVWEKSKTKRISKQKYTFAQF